MSRPAGRPRVVFDCNICIQSIAFETSAAAEALRLMEKGIIEVFVSRATMRELRRVLRYPEVIAISPHMTTAHTAAFQKRLQFKGILLRRVPSVFAFPRDPDDEPYLDLARAAKADFLVSRDHDLLWLMEGHTPLCKEFRHQTHPLQILEPPDFLEAVKAFNS